MSNGGEVGLMISLVSVESARQEQRVAVLRRARDILRGDARSRAGPVLDDDLLANDGPASRAKIRAITSDAAPAVKPTMSRIGRDG